MLIVSPFPPAYAGELARWLNSPREPNFTDGVASDMDAIAEQLAAKTAAGPTFALIIDWQPEGFIGFQPLADSQCGVFAGMVLAPAFRGRGLGARFLAAVVADLRSRGFRKLSAFFFADNKAIMQTFKTAGAVELAYLAGASRRGGELVDVRLWSFGEGK